MPAASRPVRVSTLASRAACPVVKNSAGQLGQHRGVALPGDQAVHDVPAGC
jgi:hypothetical protein